MEIGNQIKKYRNELGLSQEELADAVGTTERNYQRWEAGDVEPGAHFLVRLLIVLEIEDRQIINPTHEMVIEDGWVMYEVEQPSDEKIFEEEKQNLLLEIMNYDSSNNVNIFYVNDQ